MFVWERAHAIAKQSAEIANQYLQVHGRTLFGARSAVKQLQQNNVGQGRTLPVCQICQKHRDLPTECWQSTTATLLLGVPNFVPKSQEPHPMAACAKQLASTDGDSLAGCSLYGESCDNES